jgi:CHASE2 domain-containing sensor protein
LQEGKLICKPSTPLSLIAQGTTTSISQTEQQLTKGFAQAKQGIKTVQQITWLTFLLSLTLLGVIGALNHNEKASMFAWLTVACALPGFIALGASLLASNMFSSFLPTNSPALTTYLSSLLTALTARLKLYALITLAFSLISLFCSFYTRK